MSFRIPQHTRLYWHQSTTPSVAQCDHSNRDLNLQLTDQFSEVVSLDNLAIKRTAPFDGTLYIPEGYESNYAYPLIIWFNPETDFADMMNRLSSRNYLALAYHWGSQDGKARPGRCETDLFKQGYFCDDHPLAKSIRTIRHYLNVHSERIYLAGQNDYATLALDLLLHKPEWFAGAICLESGFPKQNNALADFPRMSGKQIFQQHLSADRNEPSLTQLRLAKLLFSAGMDVHTCFQSRPETDLDAILRAADAWLMKNISTAQRV